MGRMNGSEKVLAGVISILLFLIIIMGYQLTQTKEDIGIAEREKIKIHKQRIKAYKIQIKSLDKNIRKLQTQNDSLNDIKQRVKIITIREVDSISALPFIDQASFFTGEITRLDSIRGRYLDRGNS